MKHKTSLDVLLPNYLLVGYGTLNGAGTPYANSDVNKNLKCSPTELRYGKVLRFRSRIVRTEIREKKQVVCKTPLY
jgi:hypothetical protein